ncbi:MAG: hypothetical protein NT068_01465 [Candidatus Nomurabacteria bacterium]|nr:hypothetical protein [Candidatus Nomurabacteria bacterium]
MYENPETDDDSDETNHIVVLKEINGDLKFKLTINSSCVTDIEKELNGINSDTMSFFEGIANNFYFDFIKLVIYRKEKKGNCRIEMDFDGDPKKEMLITNEQLILLSIHSNTHILLSDDVIKNFCYEEDEIFDLSEDAIIDLAITKKDYSKMSYEELSLEYQKLKQTNIFEKLAIVKIEIDLRKQKVKSGR